MSAPLAFLDTETVSLVPGDDVTWEIGMVLRTPAGESTWRWQMHPNMLRADEEALKVGRWHDRFQVPPGVDVLAWAPIDYEGIAPASLSYDGLAATLHRFLDGAVIVGSGPWFDAQNLALFLGAFGLKPSWNYRLIDVKALAAGHIRATARHLPLLAGERNRLLEIATPPWNPEDLWRACGAEPASDEEKHTALGDVASVVRLYDAVMGRPV